MTFLPVMLVLSFVFRDVKVEVNIPSQQEYIAARSFCRNSLCMHHKGTPVLHLSSINHVTNKRASTVKFQDGRE